MSGCLRGVYAVYECFGIFTMSACVVMTVICRERLKQFGRKKMRVKVGQDTAWKKLKTSPS